MMLIDISSQVSESGSLHTITAMPLSEVALNDQYAMLAQSAQAAGNTVGDILKSVIKTMNNNATRRYGASGVPFLEFAVEDRPYPFDTKVGVKNPFEHPVTSSSPTTSNQRTAPGFDLQSGQFSPGTDFPALVDMVLAQSETAIKMARLSRELPPEVGNDNEDVIKDVMSIMHRVDTKVEFKGYDAVAGDYAKKITYIIKPYTSLRLLTSMGKAKNFDTDTKLNAMKAKFAKDNNLMKKQYDYIFTGLNTEVEKFDISLNFNWAISVPMFEGQSNTSGTPAQVDPSKDAATLQQDLNSKNSDLDGAKTELDTFDSSHKGSDLTTEDQQTRKTLADKVSSLDRQVTDTSNALGAKKNELAATVPPRKLPAGDSGRITDGEDLVYENAQGITKEDGKSVGGKFQGASQGTQSFLPITISQDSSNPGARATISTPNDNNGNKSMYGTLLNQLYGSFDGNLQSIELEVRGDPYWLGPGDTGEPFDSPSSDTTPNFMTGEHIFVFRFKLPLGFDETTGQVVVTKGSQAGTSQGGSTSLGNDKKGSGGNSNIFTGFYATTTVINRFEQGKFIQTLQGTRIPGWQYENIIEGREAVVNDLTKIDNSPGPDNPQLAGGKRASGSRGGSTPRGTANNNPGNLINGSFARAQPGYTGTDGHFAQFDTVEHGIAAQERLLATNYVKRDGTTVSSIISKYAPPVSSGGDNSIASYNNYVRFVTQRLGKSTVDKADVGKLAHAMRQFESPGSR